MNRNYLLAASAIALSLTACHDDNSSPATPQSDDAFVGQATGNFTADEWYPGGELGTTSNVTAGNYEDEAPAVEEQQLLQFFNKGEAFFERNFNATQRPFNGLGPAYLRASCIDCHPGYGHGKRQDSYHTTFSNGYLLAIYHPTTPGSNDGPYIAEVTGMPQTAASRPFLPPIDENKIKVEWRHVTSMPSGLPLQFEDGEKFDLIYPEVTIPEDAFNTSPRPTNIAVRLESTIGVIGTGLIDAIPEEELRKQYQQEAKFVELNPAMWDKAKNDFAATAWYKGLPAGHMADGQEVPSQGMVKRFTYALTRASLQDGPGANAIWNITNVSRSDRPKLYTTQAWAKAMSENAQVIQAISQDPTSPYYDKDPEKIREKVLNLLSPATNQFDNQWHNFNPEMTDPDFYAFMVWHRGLAIPRARNLNDPDVQRGKKLFMEMGCASCHRPTWQTGDDNYFLPDNIRGRKLPRYRNQTIHPYSDFIQHKLCMINDIHGSWCRTTPLWGRGLSLANTGAEDRLHDCRARNEIEAIMWHCYSKESQSYESALKFYKLSKADRDAVVKFIRAI